MTQEPELRTYSRREAIVFRKTTEAFGGLSNMAAGYPITLSGERILTSEALYQACRFPLRPDVQKLVISQVSPMTAKMVSKPYRHGTREDWDRIRVNVMRWCLRVKLAQNWEKFSELILSTGALSIVEESHKDPFWGARPVDDDKLEGMNVLGRLLMELREKLQSGDLDELRSVAPLPVPNFCLLGHPIERIQVSESTSRNANRPRHSTDLWQSLGQLISDPIESQHSNENVELHGDAVHPSIDAQQENTVSTTPAYRKKLIEVALPLDAINAESAREKSIRHGHPSTLHLWWARRPLAACRAVLFASLVDDPGNDLPEEEAKVERERLFRLIEQLVKWENSNNETVLAAAREEIHKSTGGNPPPVLDPFAGGGSIPLEAQRLGLEAHASDLNPVAVLINKALIELPAKFRDHKPVNPDAQHGMRGEAAPKSALAEDVRWYGRWMRDEAFRRIGHLYPKGPNGETVIAWLWARTVKCPNPACGAQMPLVRSFALSTKVGRETWVDPVVDHAARMVRFEVRQGPGAPEGTVNRLGVRCVICGTTSPLEYVRREAQAGRMSARLMAVISEGKSSRSYSSATNEQAEIASQARPAWKPDERVTTPSHDVDRLPMYGMYTWGDAFTPRQLVALTTFSDLVGEARALVLRDSGDDAEYAEAVATYLALAVDRLAESLCTLARWQSTGDFVAGAFSRQALAMLWDYAEVNPFSGSTRNFLDAVGWVVECFDMLPPGHPIPGSVHQLDAAAATNAVIHPLISTDPPYYDNVGYADLSDFFYVWLRRTVGRLYPDLFSTLLTPKAQELIAAPHRFDGKKENATRFFEQGIAKAFERMRQVESADYPMTVYYAFKQTEGSGDGSASTGWETMLSGLLQTGFAITGTWPVRTERSARTNNIEANALASSIVLVCRPRPADAPIATRKEFVRALQSDLPEALDLLINGTPHASPIAPVDLAQAAIGPGMAVFSRYSQVLEASGDPMGVRAALELINAEIDRYFSAQEGEQDGPTRFCLAWYRTHGTGEGQYGQAETLSRAANVDVAALARLGLLTSAAGKVRLKPASAYPDEAWDPATAHPLTTWEIVHRLVRALTGKKGSDAAAPIIRRLGGKAEEARTLAYLLYTEADKRGWLAEAQGYNTLVAEWGAVQNAVASSGGVVEQQRLGL